MQSNDEATRAVRAFLDMMVTLAVVGLAVACTRVSQQEPVTVPAYPTSLELIASLQSGALTSVDIVTELLQRARAAESLHAYITIDDKRALARAAELDRLRAQASVLGPLHGVPIVVKDNIHVAGIPNTAGTPGMRDFTPTADNAVVATLLDAGALVLGKTNLHELAFGITSNNAHYGAVLNPYDTTTFAGGSSGGTAAAVAAGLAPAGLGTDTGGSVRIPAALTGVVGFRPSTGRYDTAAVTPISHTRDTVGLIAPSVADIALLDGVISGAGADVLPPMPGEIRLGIPRSYYYADLDRQTAAVIDAALEKLSRAGITLVDADPPGIAALLENSAFPIALYEVARDLPDYLDEHDLGFGISELVANVASPDVRAVLSSLDGDARIGDDVYAAALAARVELQSVFAQYFDEHDLDAMLFPTTLLPARPLCGDAGTVELNDRQVPTFPTYIHNTDPASISGLPGISLPAGLTDASLPVGIELDGRRMSDRELLAVALRLEAILGFRAHPPPRE